MDNTTRKIALGDKALEWVAGDITRESLDAIVNAANSTLMGGGGVDGAIHRAGGPAILDECREIVARISRLPAGDAVATTAGRLPSKYVIHTVGPVWRGGGQGEPETLARCYRSSLQVADELGLASIAFPAISTGIYGYPMDAAALVAMTTLRDELPRCRYLRLARLVLFGVGPLDAQDQAARVLFPNSQVAG